MQVIQTKYIGPSDSRGSRIRAWCDFGSISIPYPHQLSGQAVYRAAADALVVKLGWQDAGPLLGGALPCNAGYVFVFDNDDARG